MSGRLGSLELAEPVRDVAEDLRSLMIIEEEVEALGVEVAPDPSRRGEGGVQGSHVLGAGEDVPAAVEEENGKVESGGLPGHALDHGAEGVEEAEGEGREVVGIGLHLVLVHDASDHFDVLLAGEGFERERKPGKEGGSQTKGGAAPRRRVVRECARWARRESGPRRGWIRPVCGGGGVQLR